MKNFIFLLLTLLGFSLFAQETNISGNVSDQNGTPIPGAAVQVLGEKAGAVTDFNGDFSLYVKKFPATLEITYLGYASAKVVLDAPKRINVILKENNEFLDDVVVTASRTREKIKESPVSIERLGAKEIKRTTAVSFYDGLENLKGVQLNTSSLTFQAVNTRGFAAFANERFIQLVDDMDNTSPALNFPLGNLVGMNELDVESVEILPGASSALYGANAFNGILNMRSKSPFKHKGLSVYVKTGITKQELAGQNNYYDVGIRHAWGNEVAAAKINFSFLKGTDWLADDNRDMDMNPMNATLYGTRASNPSYDGLNVYGDEIATTLPISAATGGALSDIRVSRTGYKEVDLVDGEAKSIKGDVAFHYRPSGQPGSLEFIWNTRLGYGKTLYQGANRYALDGILIHQHKLEVKNKNFFIRAYYTGEDAGNSYDTRFAGWNINRKWRSDLAWFTDYGKVYVAARLGLLPQFPGHHFTEPEAHAMARDFADNSPVGTDGQPKTPRFQPGSDEFKLALTAVREDPDFKTGARFIDHTNLKHIEANYNFRNLLDFAEIQVGGSMRRYSLHSEGTIFTDYKDLSPLSIDEAGAYIQISKKLLGNRLKLATSLRYDKQKKFDGNFSPRVSAVYSAGENKEHNFRLSYQTGFRNPTTQSLYIGLNLGPITLVGAAEDNWDRYHETIQGTDPGTGANFDVDITGRDAYTNAYTLNSFMKFATTHNIADLEIAKVGKPRPEQIQTIEFGYRGAVKKLGVDFSVYYNKYNDFGSATRVMALASSMGNVADNTALNAIGTGSYKPFQLYINTDQDVTSYGMDIGLNYRLNDFVLGLIYDYAKMDFDKSKDPDFRAGFNTPEHRVKVSLGNDQLIGGLGFKVDYKYQTEFLWQASFGDGMVPARSVLDAQVSYRLKDYKTKIKVGGTNLLGTEYMPAPGTGLVGSMYYVSLTYGN